MTRHLIDYEDKLPLLTEVVGDVIPGNLPILTEIVTEYAPSGEPRAIIAQDFIAGKSVASCTFSAEQMQQLLQQLEVHLETVFAEKLNHHLERLQKLAIDLAISELKAELPLLLHEALTKADVRSL